MKKQSFTLVELLVVVGIIALLAGVIIPAVSMAQTSARRTACLSNQGQVMKIMRAYMNEGDKQFLPGYANDSWTSALNRINRLGNDMTAFRCPSMIPARTPAQFNPHTVTAATLDEAYGMIYSTENDVTGIDFRGSRALTVGSGSSAYTVAGNQLALGGCSATLDNEQIIARSRINFNATGAPGSGLWGRPALVHGDQVNIFYLDGHAGSFTRQTLYRKAFYTNVISATNREALAVANSTANPDSTGWIFDPDKEEEN